METSNLSVSLDLSSVNTNLNGKKPGMGNSQILPINDVIYFSPSWEY